MRLAADLMAFRKMAMPVRFTAGHGNTTEDRPVTRPGQTRAVVAFDYFRTQAPAVFW
jgi:hypothetical protein